MRAGQGIKGRLEDSKREDHHWEDAQDWPAFEGRKVNCIDPLDYRVCSSLQELELVLDLSVTCP